MNLDNLNTPPAPAPDDILTLEEAADILRISYSTAKTLAASGELPATKVGRQYRISRRALEAYIG